MQKYKVIYRDTSDGQDVEYETLAKSPNDAAFKLGLELGWDVGDGGHQLWDDDKRPWIVSVRVMIG